MDGRLKVFKETLDALVTLEERHGDLEAHQHELRRLQGLAAQAKQDAEDALSDCEAAKVEGERLLTIARSDAARITESASDEATSIRETAQREQDLSEQSLLEFRAEIDAARAELAELAAELTAAKRELDQALADRDNATAETARIRRDLLEKLK